MTSYCEKKSMKWCIVYVHEKDGVVRFEVLKLNNLQGTPIIETTWNRLEIYLE